MNIHDLLLKIKKKTLEELVPVSAITTNEDICYYQKQNYQVTLLNNIKNEFSLSEDILKHLYYEKDSFDGLLYYDIDNFALFPTNIYISNKGLSFLGIHDITAEEFIKKKNKNHRKLYKKAVLSLSIPTYS